MYLLSLAFTKLTTKFAPVQLQNLQSLLKIAFKVGRRTSQGFVNRDLRDMYMIEYNTLMYHYTHTMAFMPFNFIHNASSQQRSVI